MTEQPVLPPVDSVITTPTDQTVVQTPQGEIKIVETQWDKFLSLVRGSAISFGAVLFPLLYEAYKGGSLTWDTAGMYVLGGIILTAGKKWIIDTYK